MSDVRVCPRCDDEKELDAFYNAGSYCRPCTADYQRERYHRLKSAQPGDNTGGNAGIRAAKWASYGATAEQVITLEYMYQMGTQCDICAIEIAGDAIHVDHDHIKMVIRGALCLGCNVGLGHFKDNTQSLNNAVEYLNRSKFNHVLHITRT